MPDPIINYLPPWFVNSLSEEARQRLQEVPAYVGDVPWYLAPIHWPASREPPAGYYYHGVPLRYIWLDPRHQAGTTPMHESIHAIDPSLNLFSMITGRMPEWRARLLQSPRVDIARDVYTAGGKYGWRESEFLPMSLQLNRFALSELPPNERAAWLQSGLFRPIAAVPEELVRAGRRSWQHEGRKLGLASPAPELTGALPTEPFPDIYPPPASPPPFIKPLKLSNLIAEQLMGRRSYRRHKSTIAKRGRGPARRKRYRPFPIGREHY